MRICIITPGHLSTNPRLTKEADALCEAGYVVKVIAADYMDWAREADKSFSDRTWQTSMSVAFGPDAPPLRRVIQVGRHRLARFAVKRGARMPCVIRMATHPIVTDLISAAKKIPSDLYIAHYPAALPAAALAAEKYGAKYAFDAEDFHVGEWHEHGEHDLDRHLIRNIEGRYLTGCSYVTAASPGIADAYVNEYHIDRPTVVLNTFPLSQAPPPPGPVGSASPGPSLYWFSQTIGPDRGLECAVRAIGLARSRPHLYLRGKPANGFIRHLNDLASESGVSERIHYLPPAEPHDMERLASAFDMGLAGETGHSKNRQIALSNKIFSYLLAGIPIMLSDIPAHRALVGELGPAAFLYALEDAESLASSVDFVLCKPAVLAKARAAAYQLGQARFNWQAVQSALIQCVDRTLGRACGV